MKKVVKFISNTLTAIVLIAVIGLAVLLVGVRAFGLTPMAVLSGSMEPTYRTGSIVYIKPVMPVEVKVGDPITFNMEDGKTVVTHRVVKIDSDNQLFHTKGDANDSEDATPVAFSNLIGIPVFTIPYLGFIAKAVSGKMAPYIIIGVIGLIGVLYLVPSIISDASKKDVEQPQPKDNAS